MKQFSTIVVCAVLAATVFAHDGHGHDDQMPLGYVKYPYQAVYPGDNEGRLPGSTIADSDLPARGFFDQ